MEKVKKSKVTEMDCVHMVRVVGGCMHTHMTHGLPVALKSAQPFLFLLNAEDGLVLKRVCLLICPQSMNKKELNDTLESAVLFFVVEVVVNSDPNTQFNWS